MASTPQASTTSSAPEPISEVARPRAYWEEPHWLSTVEQASGFGTAVGQPGGAGQVHGLGPDLVDDAPHHLVHLGRLDPGPAQHLHLHGPEDVGRVGLGQRAVPLADGRAAGLHDDDLAHGSSSSTSPGAGAPADGGAPGPSPPARRHRRPEISGPAPSCGSSCATLPAGVDRAGRCGRGGGSARPDRTGSVTARCSTASNPGSGGDERRSSSPGCPLTGRFPRSMAQLPGLCAGSHNRGPSWRACRRRGGRRRPGAPERRQQAAGRTPMADGGSLRRWSTW